MVDVVMLNMVMVNFVKDRIDGGCFLNWDLEKVSMNLLLVEVGFLNICGLV